MNSTTVAVDLAKSVFELALADGRVIRSHTTFYGATGRQ
jgi:hypothetical protein